MIFYTCISTLIITLRVKITRKNNFILFSTWFRVIQSCCNSYLITPIIEMYLLRCFFSSYIILASCIISLNCAVLLYLAFTVTFLYVMSFWFLYRSVQTWVVRRWQYQQQVCTWSLYWYLVVLHSKSSILNSTRNLWTS